MNPQAHSKIIKEIAKGLNFTACGCSKATFLEEEADRLESWLRQGQQGKMSYMENHFDKRLDPSKLVPGAKTVVSLLYNYFPDQEQEASNDNFKVSKYAYGKDYHFVIKEKLKSFMQELRLKVGNVEGRVFVDSAPVMERAWAAKSGLGWVGKNSLLINPKKGSFFFLAELIIDLEVEPDHAIKDYCGTCNKCITACPTDAITEPYVVDGSKCISYFTIELKDEIPKLAGNFQDWIFGCDICQDVCPWNRFSSAHKEPEFEQGQWKNWSKDDWLEMTEEVFSKAFSKSPLKRSKFKGIKRNIAHQISQKSHLFK